MAREPAGRTDSSTSRRSAFVARRRAQVASLADLVPQSRPISGSRFHGLVEPLGQPGMTLALGWKSSGSTARLAGIEIVVGVGQVDDSRETRGPCRLDQGGLVGRVARSADAGNEHPDDRHAARLAVGGHRLVDPGEDVPMPGLERPLVLVRAAERPGAGALERRVVDGGIPAEPAPAGSAAAVRPSRRRPRSTRRSPGRASSASRSGRSDTSAGRGNARVRRS